MFTGGRQRQRIPGLVDVGSAPSFELGWLDREPYRSWLPTFREQVRALDTWPSPDAYDRLARLGRSASAPVVLPRFVPFHAADIHRAGGYEAVVATASAVPSREQNWHDFFNMAVWAHLPRVRWALNRLHVTADRELADPRNGRTPLQNIAAQFDESGLIVASSDSEVFTDLEALAFKRVFWERRVSLSATTRFVVVGHGSLESLLRPHFGLVGKGLFVRLSSAPPTDAVALFDRLDELAAEQIVRWERVLTPLAPVPFLGIPGWHPAQSSEFYDNTHYFRQARSRKR